MKQVGMHIIINVQKYMNQNHNSYQVLALNKETFIVHKICISSIKTIFLWIIRTYCLFK